MKTDVDFSSLVYKNLRGEVAYLASGLSSSMNWGRRLLTSEADVVTAHGMFDYDRYLGLHNSLVHFSVLGVAFMSSN